MATACATARGGVAAAAAPQPLRQQLRSASAALASGSRSAACPRSGARRTLAVAVQAVVSPPKAPASAGVGPAGSPSGFDFGSYVATTSQLVEAELDKAIPQQYPSRVHEAMRYSLLGAGKRIRPMLCLAACELVGGTAAVALPTAASLEMIHTMSLIHDDLPSMDNDDFRRGKPTCHKVYGEDVAILAGDAMLARSFEYIARDTKGVPAERVLRVLADVGKAVGGEGLVGGQVVDLEMEGRFGAGEPAGLDTLRWIHTHKTGALLEVAVVAGAVLGGAAEAQVEALRQYAVAIGVAFQVIDDILDVTATSEQLGKTAGKDLKAQKTTYPKLMGLEGSRAEAARLIAEAKAQLVGFDAKKAAPLVALADYIASRQN